MQKLAEVSIRRPVFAAMLVLALVVIGPTGYTKLGVDRFPSVDLPTVSVRTVLRGASPEEMETEVSQRIEEAVNTVEGINELRSISGAGASIIIVTFNLDRDIDVAAQDVRDRVPPRSRDLPRDVDPPIVCQVRQRFGAGLDDRACPGNRSLRELTEIADKTREGSARALGGRRRGAARRRASNGRSTSGSMPTGWPPTRFRSPPCATPSSARTPTCPGGNVTAGLREQSLRTMGRITDPRRSTTWWSPPSTASPIRVRDIGCAEDGTKEQRSAARLNGVPDRHRWRSGASRARTRWRSSRRSRRTWPGSQRRAAGRRQARVIRDQSRYIYAALHEINLHLILGSILASLVVLRVHAELALDAHRRASPSRARSSRRSG